MNPERQDALSVIRTAGLTAAQIADLEKHMNVGQLVALAESIKEHMHDDQHWLQAHKDRLLPIICSVDRTGPVAVLFYLKCANCGGTAVFTAEGPNDEYPEPLCEKCEGGDDADDDAPREAQFDVEDSDT